MASRLQKDDEWQEDAAGQESTSDDDGGPGEHDRHLMEDDEQEVTVKCPGCGKRVWADAERCPECGAYFADQAWNDQVAGELPRVPNWIWWTAIALLAVFLGCALALW